MALALLFSVWAVSAGWAHNLLDLHGFRQTQTAISAYYLAAGSPFFAYETPVLGPPWSIPFEFPLYQEVVAVLVSSLHLNLESAGRLVSVSFFYLTLLPFLDVLRSLGVALRDRLIFVCFLLVSPLYLFWSRTFMIESTALFFSIAYLALSMRFVSHHRRWSWLGALICGCLGGLVKLTTLYAFWVAAVAFAAWRIWQRDRIDLRRLAMLCGLFAVPVVTAVAWTRFADVQRSLNPFADFLQASNLTAWNFGTLHQRLDVYPTWWAISVRTIKDTCGTLAFYVTAASILWSRKYLSYYISCLTLYLVSMMTFTNLHVIHEYYPYAIGIFVISAQGFAVSSLLQGTRVQRAAGLAMVALFLPLSAWSYINYQYGFQARETRGVTPLARAVEALSRPSDVLIIYGLDWSSELPYYAHRRALMIRSPQELTPQIIDSEKTAISQQGYRVGPLVGCHLSQAYLRTQARLWGLDLSRETALQDCHAYRPAD
ncbi:MAG TPA: hypothetical protein VGF24_06545 [Vicinamibacterales bacterium]